MITQTVLKIELIVDNTATSDKKPYHCLSAFPTLQ